jgi:hypothetical protein
MMHYGTVPVFCDANKYVNIDASKIEKLCEKLPKNLKP